MDDHVAPDETPDFLARLGLRADADVRAIKRAYAREVKQIDQESDAAGFQDLRDAYETALRWAAYQGYLAEQAVLAEDIAGAPGDVTPAQQADLRTVPAATAPIDPDALSKLVFDRLTGAIAELMRERMMPGLVELKTALEWHLESDELFNITARTYFEARIVYHLAEGWKHGNDILLPAAASVFHWSNDRRRLLQFGQAGNLINHAIDEHNLFERQEDLDLRLQRSILHRLREGKPTTLLRLRQDIPQLDMMLERFPTMMHCMAPRATLQQWREKHASDDDANMPMPLPQQPPWVPNRRSPWETRKTMDQVRPSAAGHWRSSSWLWHCAHSRRW